MDPLIQVIFLVIGAGLTCVGIFMRRSESRTAEVNKLEAHIEKQIDKVVAELRLVHEDISSIKIKCGANHPGVNERLGELEAATARLVDIEKRLSIVEIQQRPSIIAPRQRG
jgi:hypothetical protein